LNCQNATLAAHQFMGIINDVSSKCSKADADLLPLLDKYPSVTTVILSARWSLYAETQRAAAEKEGPSFLIDALSDPRTVENSRRVLANGLERTVSRLEARGMRVVIIGQVPEFPFDPSQCVIRSLWSGRTPDCSEPESYTQQRFAAAKAILEGVAARHRSAAYVDPEPAFCRQGMCRSVTSAGQLLYRDPDHLTVEGAQRMAPRLPQPVVLTSSVPGAVT